VPELETPSAPVALAAEPRLWFGYLANQLAHRIRQATAQALAPLGLTPPSLRVLAFIAADQPLTQTQLGRRTGMDRTTITRFVDRLEALGLAQRQTDAADRRAHALTLTPAGGRALAAAEAAAAAQEDALLAPLNPAERATLIALMARLHPEHLTICPDPDPVPQPQPTPDPEESDQ
jgi:DNA-binding MarR family transcriptional regulator